MACFEPNTAPLKPSGADFVPASVVVYHCACVRERSPTYVVTGCRSTRRGGRDTDADKKALFLFRDIPPPPLVRDVSFPLSNSGTSMRVHTYNSRGVVWWLSTRDFGFPRERETAVRRPHRMQPQRQPRTAHDGVTQRKG